MDIKLCEAVPLSSDKYSNTCGLTKGPRGRCSVGSGGTTRPPGGRRTQRTTRGCGEAPRSPVKHSQ